MCSPKTVAIVYSLQAKIKKNQIGESGTYLGMSINIFSSTINIPIVFEVNKDRKLKSGVNVL